MAACPTCKTDYSYLSQHWRQAECPYPQLTAHQEEVLTGILMGDGNIKRDDGKNPYFRCKMVTPEYLEWLDDLLGALSTGVRFILDNSGNPEQDVYEVSTRRMPIFDQFVSWYRSGEKVWPTNIRLTPTVLKHLYVCDGYYATHHRNNYMTISMSNEGRNKRKFSRYLQKRNLPSPDRWKEYERDNPNHKTSCEACWTVRNSKRLFKYMGDPPPGFEYKWP